LTTTSWPSPSTPSRRQSQAHKPSLLDVTKGGPPDPAPGRPPFLCPPAPAPHQRRPLSRSASSPKSRTSRSTVQLFVSAVDVGNDFHYEPDLLVARRKAGRGTSRSAAEAAQPSYFHRPGAGPTPARAARRSADSPGRLPRRAKRRALQGSGARLWCVVKRRLRG